MYNLSYFSNHFKIKKSIISTFFKCNYGLDLIKSQTKFQIRTSVTKKEVIIKNNHITFPGASKWELMTRNEALLFAKKCDLDLVLVDQIADPPVCKLQDYGKLIKKMKIKRKEEKIRTMKELYFTAGISLHDLNIKLDKAKDFLEDGHPVKVTVSVKSDIYKKDPTAIDQTLYAILNLVEKFVFNVKQVPSKSMLRRELVLNPKPKTDVINSSNTTVSSNASSVAKNNNSSSSSSNSSPVSTISSNSDNNSTSAQ